MCEGTSTNGFGRVLNDDLSALPLRMVTLLGLSVLLGALPMGGRVQ